MHSSQLSNPQSSQQEVCVPGLNEVVGEVNASGPQLQQNRTKRECVTNSIEEEQKVVLCEGQAHPLQRWVGRRTAWGLHTEGSQLPPPKHIHSEVARSTVLCWIGVRGNTFK